MLRLDGKLARIRSGAYSRANFVLAAALDSEMGPGIQGAGPARSGAAGQVAHPRGVHRRRRGGDQAGRRRHHAGLGLQSRAAGGARRLRRHRREAGDPRQRRDRHLGRARFALRDQAVAAVPHRLAVARAFGRGDAPSQRQDRADRSRPLFGDLQRRSRRRSRHRWKPTARSAPTRRPTTSAISSKCSIPTPG